MGGLLHPHLSLQFSLEQALNEGLIDTNTRQSLSELERALLVVKKTKSSEGQQQNALPVSAAAERGLITEEECLRILELQMNTGGLRTSAGLMMNLKEAEEKRLLTPLTLAKLQAKSQCQELVDPNTAEQLSLHELRQRCVSDGDSGLLLLPVQQQPGGTVCLRSGKRVGIFRAVQEGLIDRKVAVRLLEAQLFAGGIADPRSGHRLAVSEAVHHGLVDQDLACALFVRQLKNGGILDPFSGERLDLEESIHRNLVSSRSAVVVLESLCAFAGMLWPESGEIMPVVEALQQGVISGELSRNILRHRHAIGALYNPGTLQLLPLTQATEQHLDPSAAIYLKNTRIPDVLPSRNQSAKSALKPLSSDSTCSIPPSFALLPPASPEAIDCDATTQDESEHRLLSHIISHSYVDAHSGKRLLLLDPELNEVVKANILVSKDVTDAKQSTPSTYEQGTVKVAEQLNLADQGLSETQQAEADREDSIGFEKNDTSTGEKKNKSLYSQSTVENVIALRVAKDSEDESEFIDASPKKPEGPKFAAELNPTPSSSFQSPAVKDSGDMELEKLAQELKQEGLLNLDGNKLLPDEAVAQGLLSGYMAVKVMAEANLFGGFMDAGSGESLTVDDVTQDEDEALMWRVLQSDKSLSGVFDVDQNCVCSVTEAGQTGLLDPNTTVRLLEAQVVSGGIVDLRRNEKVSVTTAADLGLIEESQKEELMVLESAYKGKNVNSAVSLIKATLQLQMDGVVDPETRSPVPLEQAIQNKFIKPDEAYQVLTKQVAEGGIVHHASGLRLSVSDAVDRGLVNRSVASGLQELEWIFKGKVNYSSHPEAFTLQASTGAILDPESGCKLTLTEAVSKGLLDGSVADKAMTSSVMTQGVLDPKSACIVPFSELVKQGRIDIHTGQRFLAVKPFRGIQDEKTGEKMTLREAVAFKKVDPVPSFRLLQSQANSGGIVDITTGERLSLLEACKRGLIEDDAVRLLAVSQFLEGGIVDPVSGNQVSSLDDAVAQGLISSQIALDISEKMASVDVRDDEGSSTPLDSLKSANNVDVVNTVRKETIPESVMKTSESVPKQMQEEKVQEKIRESDSVEKCVQAHTEKDSLQAPKAATVSKNERCPSDESKISLFHEPGDRKGTDFVAEEIKDEMEEIGETGKGDAAEKQDDDDLNVKEKPAKMDGELPDRRQTSLLNDRQNKNRKKKKKVKKDKDSMKEAQLRRKEPSDTDQVDTRVEGESDAHGAVRETSAAITDVNIAGNNIVKQGLIADPATLKQSEQTSESRRDQVKAASAKNTETGDKNEELKREEKENEAEEKPSVSQETKQQTSQDVKKRKEVDLPQKHVLPDDENAAPTLKSKESLLKKDFAEGVSEKQTANELEASHSELGKESQHPAAQDVKVQTPSPDLNGEGAHEDEDASGSKPLDPSQFASTATSKESCRELATVKSDAAVEKVSEKRATEALPLKTSSNERGKKCSSKEDVQENMETTQLVPSTEKDKGALYSKQQKKKKNKTKVRDAGQKKSLPPGNMDAGVATITNLGVEKTDLEESANKPTNGQSAGEIVKPQSVDEATKTGIDPENSLLSPSDFHQSEESTSPLKGEQKRSAVTPTGQGRCAESEKSTGFSQDALKPDVQPTAQSVEFGAQPDKTLKMQQPPKGSPVPEFKSVKEQKQNSGESAEDNSEEYESTNPECDSAPSSCEEENVKKDGGNMDSNNTRTSSKIRKVTRLSFVDNSFDTYRLCTCLYIWVFFCLEFYYLTGAPRMLGTGPERCCPGVHGQTYRGSTQAAATAVCRAQPRHSGRRHQTG